jgi:hypothetical protein
MPLSGRANGSHRSVGRRSHSPGTRGLSFKRGPLERISSSAPFMAVGPGPIGIAHGTRTRRPGVHHSLCSPLPPFDCSKPKPSRHSARRGRPGATKHAVGGQRELIFVLCRNRFISWNASRSHGLRYQPRGQSRLIPVNRGWRAIRLAARGGANVNDHRVGTRRTSQTLDIKDASHLKDPANGGLLNSNIGRH